MKKILLSLIAVLGFCNIAYAEEDSTSMQYIYGAYRSQDNPSGTIVIPTKLNMRTPRVGTIIQYPMADIPSAEKNGWMLCDGRTLNRYDDRYKNLFNVIGYTYGGSGSYFSLPNLMNQGQFLRGYKAGMSGKMGETQAVMAHSPYTAEFWTMTKNTGNYSGSVEKVQTKSTHRIKVEQFSGIQLIFNDNETTQYGKRVKMVYNNKDKSSSGDEVRPVNYAVSYWIMTEGNDFSQEAPTPSNNEDTSLSKALADLQAMEKLLKQYYEELEELAKDLDTNYDEVQDKLTERNDCYTYLLQAKQLKEACQAGTGLEQGENSGNSAYATSMPKDMANWMSTRGLKYDTTGNDLYNNAKEWDIAINSLQSYYDSCDAAMDDEKTSAYAAKQKQIQDLEANIEKQRKVIQSYAQK